MKICKNCGNEFEVGEFCPNCGTKYEAPVEQNTFVEAAPEQAAAEQAASDPGKVKGIIALVMGILSLINSCSCGAGIVFAIVGMILGSSAVSSSTAAGFENKMGKIGKTLSIVGIILGVLGLVFWIIYYIFYFAVMVGNY